ncbi:MAG: glycosyltransferase [Odoribacter sp.]
MKYSIIIAVYNRLEEVIELLASAENLIGDRSTFELLFVDDGSKDGFQEFIETYQSKSHLQIRAIYQQNQGPGAARNFGMSEAKGDYFIFVDSDCMFPSHWLAEIEKVQELYHYDTFGGPDTCHPSFSPLLKAINYSMTSFIGTGGTRGNKKHIGRFYPRSFNMGISREVYHTIGGMGGLRHGQDMDYSMRIYNAGFKVGLIADAFVYHKRRTSIAKFFRQIFNWGVARINLTRRHPHTLKPIHLFPAILIVGLVLLTIFSLLVPTIGYCLWTIICLCFIAVCLFAFVQSLLKYHNLPAAFLSILTLNIQVFAYGLGLLWGLGNIGKGKDVKGFSRNYYGEK